MVPSGTIILLSAIQINNQLLFSSVHLLKYLDIKDKIHIYLYSLKYTLIAQLRAELRLQSKNNYNLSRISRIKRIVQEDFLKTNELIIGMF